MSTILEEVAGVLRSSLKGGFWAEQARIRQLHAQKAQLYAQAREVFLSPEDVDWGAIRRAGKDRIPIVGFLDLIESMLREYHRQHHTRRPRAEEP